MLKAYGVSAVAEVSSVLARRAWGFQSAVAIALASLLALPPQARAQQPAVPQPATQQPVTLNPAAPAQTPNPAPLPVESLRILVLVGQDSSNDIRDRVTSSPVVEVRDANGQPVEGADVVFELPAIGPGGAFAGQNFTATAKTNLQGQATVTFMPNRETGRYNIKVSATSANRVGHIVIRQTNALHAASSEPKSGLLKFAWWKVAVLAGAGATIGFLVARRGGSSGPSVTLIPGTPTFGAP
ncbi:MAG: hypothetical protein LAP40_02315 [Acidobacteriia bacterium]|nr:hypothetical protein [Terriglobia bacterium]